MVNWIICCVTAVIQQRKNVKIGKIMDQYPQSKTDGSSFAGKPSGAINRGYQGESKNNIFLNKADAKKFSNVQPAWRLVVLSVFTLGIYEIYWFYRNWEQLKAHKNLDLSPRWRTVGLFVPLVGIIFILQQFQDIRNFSREVGIAKSFSPGWILAAYVLLTAFQRLPEPYSCAYLLAVLPLAVVQDVLNAYWTKEQPGLPERRKFTPAEIVLLAIGAIFWGYIILGIIVYLYIMYS
ncbi:MAG TPA: hypothetical protein VLB04_09425 [Methanotrichaceae archaeon]|nr:hypothetical protein [Methanotrichaceae archaeon]